MFSTRGWLVVAGVTNLIDMDVRFDRLETNRFRFSGAKTLKMNDFGVTPPSPKLLMDMIKTGDEVKIRFDWYTGLRRSSSASSL